MPKFKAKIEAQGPGGAWSFLQIPFNVEQVFGSKARVAVKGTINGFAFRTSIFPNGDGTHHMMINKQMMAGAGARAGDAVAMTLERDTAPRIVKVPADLKKALNGQRAAKTFFEKLAPSHKKAYVDWITGAKKAETRARRVAGTIERLRLGKKQDD
jgi:hypothetical protein